MPVRLCLPGTSGSVFIFHAIIAHAFSSFRPRSASDENLIRINRRGTFQPCAIDVAGIPLSRLKSALSLAQDRCDRAGWTDGRRSRQGPMTGWSWTPAAFRGSFAVPRGAIYYRGSSRRGRSRFSPPSRKRTETRGVTARGGAGGGRKGSVQGLLENLYTQREGIVYTAEGRVDLIRWWFFNETSCARHLRDRPWFTAPILRGAKGRRNAARGHCVINKARIEGVKANAMENDACEMRGAETHPGCLSRTGNFAYSRLSYCRPVLFRYFNATRNVQREEIILHHCDNVPNSFAGLLNTRKQFLHIILHIILQYFFSLTRSL